MTSTSKNLYIDKLVYIEDEFNKTYHRTIKVKPADINTSTYIVFAIENNDKGPNVDVSDHVKIWKYKKKIFPSLHSKLVRRNFYD